MRYLRLVQKLKHISNNLAEIENCWLELKIGLLIIRKNYMIIFFLSDVLFKTPCVEELIDWSLP